jgi:hypothetical protein
MERERPEYLEPIPRSRWEFPWLGMWAVLLIGAACAGVWLHVKTGEAWTSRFRNQPTSQAPAPAERITPPDVQANRQVMIDEIRARREEAERQARRARSDHRCIGGVVLRRIPGGWENVPGETCR